MQRRKARALQLSLVEQMAIFEEFSHSDIRLEEPTDKLYHIKIQECLSTA